MRRTLLLVILVLLPIDWFAPTGLLLREAGAKPLNLFLLICMLAFCMRGKNFFFARVYPSISLQTYLALIVIFGTFAFLNNIAFMPSVPITDRSQLFQYTSQTAMLLLFMAGLQTLIYLFGDIALRQRVIDMLPLAASLHLLFYALEGLEIFNQGAPGMLAFFRNEQGLIERPSGLMSEPSYYGTFAAMYATPLILFGGKHKNLNRILAIALLITALLINAKTMFMVLGAQLLYLALARKSASTRAMFVATIVLVILGGGYLVTNGATLNFDENLSSVMRLGSNMLTLNVATEGYGLIGVGTGQFHFMYRPEFAPDYLFLSQEALDQMYGISGSRASTFNLPLRFLVESGLPGLLLAGLMFFRVFWLLRHTTDQITQTGLCFLAGSLGFLMTQDSYSLPSLAFGLALALTGAATEAGNVPPRSKVPLDFSKR
jgi:hypothetical protein